MPRTDIPALVSSGPHLPGTVAETLTWTNADVANLNSFTLTGRELLLIWNSHATIAQTYTLTGANDPYARTRTITESLPALAYRFYEATDLAGWLQSDGKFYLQGGTVDIRFAIIRLKH